MRNGRVVILGDCHVPFHDKRAYELALKIVQALKPDYVVQIGDFADLVAVSGHGKEFGVNVSLDHELSAIQDEWSRLEHAAGRSQVVAIQGNHETRLLRYVAQNASKIESIVPSFEKLFCMGEGTKLVPYQVEFKIGRVVYVHDVGYSGAQAARQTLVAVNHNVVFGHSHRGTVFYSGDTNGKQRFSLNVGWLGSPKSIKYVAPAKTREWQQGIGIVDYRDGLAFAQFVAFVNYKAVIDGRLYK